jgi:hypothetical protein
MKTKQWYVTIRRSVTKKIVDGPKTFPTREQAQQYARDYNRNHFKLNSSWDCPVAITQDPYGREI